MISLRKIQLRLDSPLKRVASTLLLISTPFFIGGSIQIFNEANSFSDFLPRLWDALFTDDHWGGPFHGPARYGFYGVSIGLVFSFLYDASLGRFLYWIRHG